MATNAKSWAQSVFDGLPTQLPANERFAITLNDLVYGCHFAPLKRSQSLVVWLLSSPGPERVVPIFGKARIGHAVGSSTLTISDPTLFMDERLTASIFLGTEAQDPIDGVVAIALVAAGQLGVEPKDITFMGVSAGCFASIAAASRLGAAAVGLNPQLDVVAAAQDIAEGTFVYHAYRPGADIKAWTHDRPLRTDAVAIVNKGREEGHPARVAIFQNIVDRYHYDRHFTPFCHAFGLDPKAPVSTAGNIQMTLLDYPEAHHSTRETIDALLQSGVPFVRARQDDLMAAAS